MSDIKLTQIITPELGSDSYGVNIKKQFDNIDGNFTQIVEGEYLKGQSGDLVMLEVIDLTSTENHEIRDAFHTFISELEVGDNGIGNEEDDINSSKLYMIYTLNQENGEKIYKTSLPYTFLDPRFNPVTNDVKDNGSMDKSCIIMYDGEKFVSYNAFPNIYFNGDQNEFCWKINGLPTSLPARGPKGDTGYNGAVYILSASVPGDYIPQNSQPVRVNFLIKPPKYSSLDITNEVAKEVEGQAAFVYTNVKDDNGNNKQYIYISQIETYIEGENIYAECVLDNACEIHQIFANQTFKDVLTYVKPDADLNSIFIPISFDENNDILAHTITTQKKDDKLDGIVNKDDANTVIISPSTIKSKGRNLVSSEGYTLYNNYNTICSGALWAKHIKSPTIITPLISMTDYDSRLLIGPWQINPEIGEDGLENLHLHHISDGTPERGAGNLFVNNEKISTINYVDKEIDNANQSLLLKYFTEENAYDVSESWDGGGDENHYGENFKILSGYRHPIQLWESDRYTDPMSFKYHQTALPNIGSQQATYRILINLSEAKSYISYLRFKTKFKASGAANNNKIVIKFVIIDLNGETKTYEQERAFYESTYEVDATITFKNNEVEVSSKIGISGFLPPA